MADSVVVRISPAKKLRIYLPGQGEYALKTMTPEFFEVEDIQKVSSLFMLDRLGQSRAVISKDEKEGIGSSKREVNAIKRGKFNE